MTLSGPPVRLLCTISAPDVLQSVEQAEFRQLAYSMRQKVDPGSEGANGSGRFTNDGGNGTCFETEGKSKSADAAADDDCPHAELPY